jgi:hypothetical protein
LINGIFFNDVASQKKHFGINQFIKQQQQLKNSKIKNDSVKRKVEQLNSIYFSFGFKFE